MKIRFCAKKYFFELYPLSRIYLTYKKKIYQLFFVLVVKLSIVKFYQKQITCWEYNQYGKTLVSKSLLPMLKIIYAWNLTYKKGKYE